ncbi:MAG: CHAD domain-containing protein [Alphaproteobacteria bacterium]
MKFVADAESVARLRKSEKLRAQTVGPVRTRRLVSTYHDTPDDRLFSAGIAWQIKRNGRTWTQTVSPFNGHGAIHSSVEARLRTPDADTHAVPDQEIADAVKDALKDETTLGPRVATEITRTERRLMTPRGDIVDLALDTSDVVAGETRDRTFEVELELKAGTPESLIEIARPLAADMPLELSLVSAAERGFRLLKGKPPGKAPWIVLPREASSAEALTTILSSCLRHIALHAAEARKGEGSEAIHQIRVSLRRLRAVLSDYARAFGCSELKVLADRARDLALLLSPARDLDVFLSDILLPAREFVTYPEALAHLAENAQNRRVAAWSTARAALDHADYRLFLIDVAAVALCGVPNIEAGSTPVASLPARELAGEVLDRALHKVKSFGERLDELSTEERHELRKRLKKLRYPAEFFASLFDAKGTKKFFMCLTDLQDDLGSLNDVATARALLQEMVQFLAGEDARCEPRLAMTAGEIVGWHSCMAERGLKRIAKHWTKFEDAPRFWRKG